MKEIIVLGLIVASVIQFHVCLDFAKHKCYKRAYWYSFGSWLTFGSESLPELSL
ncbi:hypothetical protein K0B03_00330 [Patescibacteria group bacterium]|nr:hypothetical protein [Patescibacteria group bacterium]